MLTGVAILLPVIFAITIGSIPFGDGDSDEGGVAERLLPVGPARAGGVVVAEPVAELGHVPLDFLVEHVFHLVNDGAERVQLGRPSVVVLDGC